MTRDPNSYIAASAEHLVETLTKKNSDYAPTGEFSNFEKAADVAGISVMQLITAQIAIKMTRIEKLLGTAQSPKVIGESIVDSYLDLAGYAIIGHAYLSRLQGAMEYTENVIEDREAIRNSADDDHQHVWIHAGALDYCTNSGCEAFRDAVGVVFNG